MKWLYENNFPWNEETFINGVNSDSLEIITVNIDNDKKDWIDKYKSNNLTWNSLYAKNGRYSNVYTKYHVYGTPTYYLFDQNGTVTAGTASPLTDGASATLVCEENYAISNNLPILARIKSTAINGCPPELMGLGPIGASLKALKRAELDINDIDIIELNEAFASQSLACIK